MKSVTPGDRYGAWTVLSEVPDMESFRAGYSAGRRVRCRCECGTERAVFLASLRNGTSKSCGCQAAKNAALNRGEVTPLGSAALRRDVHTMAKSERNEEIGAMRGQGATYAEIGRRFRLGTERIRQICNRIERLKRAQQRRDEFYETHYYELDQQKLDATAKRLEEIERELDALAADINVAFPLTTPVDMLELSVRSQNCLRNERIKTVGELLRYTPEELLRVPNFGRVSLAEIHHVLSGLGLEWDSE